MSKQPQKDVKVEKNKPDKQEVSQEVQQPKGDTDPVPEIYDDDDEDFGDELTEELSSFEESVNQIMK